MDSTQIVPSEEAGAPANAGTPATAGTLAATSTAAAAAATTAERYQIGRGPRYAIAAVLVILALVSCFALAHLLSSPSFHKGTIDRLDTERNTVIGLMTTSTAAAAAISAIPDDTCTPLADKLMDVTGDFSIILAAIFLEKYLITLTGLAAFRLIVPLCLIALAVLLIRGKKDGADAAIRPLALKVGTFAIAMFLVVPCSTLVSNIINETYDVSVTSAAVQQPGQPSQEGAQGGAQGAQSGEGEGGFLEMLGNTAASIANAVGGTVSNAISTAQNMVNNLLEKFAVMVITSCVMPLLVIAFFVWLVNLFFGIDLSANASKARGAARGAVRGAMPKLGNSGSIARRK